MPDHKEPYIKKPADKGVLGIECGHHCGVITTGLTDQKQAHCFCTECHGAPEISSVFTSESGGVDPHSIK